MNVTYCSRKYIKRCRITSTTCEPAHLPASYKYMKIYGITNVYTSNTIHLKQTAFWQLRHKDGNVSSSSTNALSHFYFIISHVIAIHFSLSQLSVVRSLSGLYTFSFMNIWCLFSRTPCCGCIIYSYHIKPILVITQTVNWDKEISFIKDANKKYRVFL